MQSRGGVAVCDWSDRRSGRYWTSDRFPHNVHTSRLKRSDIQPVIAGRIQMETKISGKAFVLGDDIDTDQIIPAEYLSFDPSIPEERKYFGMYAMSGVPPATSGLPDGNVRFVQEGEFHTEYSIVIGGKNFGCGSSREHAPLAIAEAGCGVVVAEFYARIFFRNCVNGGYLLPCECTDRLIEKIKTGDECEIDFEAGTLINKTSGDQFNLSPLGDVQPIIEAGGVFEYAKQSGMMKD